MISMIMDGFIQMFSKYESTNIRRFITGFLFGVGLTTIFVETTKIALSYGINIGKNIAKWTGTWIAEVHIVQLIKSPA